MKRIALTVMFVNLAASAMGVELEKVDLAALSAMDIPAVSIECPRAESVPQAAAVAETNKISAGSPAMETAGARLKTAVLRISGYNEKELSGDLLNSAELEDLARQLNYLAALPVGDIPSELLGYLEGISLSIQELLPKGPVGRNIGPALKAARALQSKVTSIRLPEKGLRIKTRFAVGDVSMKIEGLNFTPAGVSASLVCRFKDGSGGVESRPEQALAVKVSGAGQIRQVDISAVELSHFALFTSPKSCRYVINVRSAAGTSGDFTLAGSMFNMTREELDALLSDTELNEKISAQNQPLRLVERDGYITRP